jgi:hypothetical protein
LDQIINMRHELVQLAGKIDWDFIDGEIAPLYRDSGQPGIATRFVMGLFCSSISPRSSHRSPCSGQTPSSATLASATMPS